MLREHSRIQDEEGGQWRGAGRGEIPPSKSFLKTYCELECYRLLPQPSADTQLLNWHSLYSSFLENVFWTVFDTETGPGDNHHDYLSCHLNWISDMYFPHCGHHSTVVFADTETEDR